MHSKLEAAQNKFIGSIGKLAASFGINEFTAELYAVIYLSDKPLSLDDLVERLKASKGNISLNIRELERWGAVRSVWVKGSRKDYYEAEPDVRKVAIEKVKNSVRKRIEQITDMIEEFKSLVDLTGADVTDEDRKTLRAYRDKLKKIEDMKAMASKVMGIVEKFI